MAGGCAQRTGRTLFVPVLVGIAPVNPNEHNAYNDTGLAELLSSYDNVVAWFKGHTHAGNYGFTGGTHFVNFKGMVASDLTVATSSGRVISKHSYLRPKVDGIFIIGVPDEGSLDERNVHLSWEKRHRQAVKTTAPT